MPWPTATAQTMLQQIVNMAIAASRSDLETKANTCSSIHTETMTTPPVATVGEHEGWVTIAFGHASVGSFDQSIAALEHVGSSGESGLLPDAEGTEGEAPETGPSLDDVERTIASVRARVETIRALLPPLEDLKAKIEARLAHGDRPRPPG